MTPRPLRTVGHYDLIKVIGRGGAATVYMAHQHDLRRNVALKQLDPFGAGDPTFAARFAQESHLAGSLSHSNIVTVHEYFEHEGVPYIAMEYLPRGSLRPYVGALSTAQVAGVIEGVLAGLSHGQARGLVHRDLKPENLLVTADGSIKIADFGIARSFDGAITRAVVTAAGSTIGTPAYMAPEQAEGGKLGPTTDLYSLGIIAWELLTGRVPFEDPAAPLTVLYRQVHEPVPSARSVNPEIDAEIDRWLARMLAKRPDERFPSADTAWEALEDIVLELLGPLWRREARLALEPTASAAGKPLAPARFEQTAHPGADPASPGGSAPDQHVQTEDDPIVEHETIPPRGNPDSARSTLLRIARRHAMPGHAPAEPSARPRPRALLLAVLAVTGGAGAVVGVVTGSSGQAPAHRSGLTPPPPAARSGQARRLLAVLQTVDAARTQDLAMLSAARTGPGQAAGADAIARAYKAGVEQIDRLGAAGGTSPAEQSLRSILGTIAADYAALGQAAASQNRATYAGATTKIAAAEHELRTQSAGLTKGP